MIDDQAGGRAGWGEYFRRWMDRRGMTNADLCRAAGVRDSAVSKWRRELNVPDVESCRRIAHALGRPPLEVVVAAGHLSPAEARMTNVPVPAPDEELGRLAAVHRALVDEATPQRVRDRLRLLVELAEEVANGQMGQGRHG